MVGIYLFDEVDLRVEPRGNTRDDFLSFPRDNKEWLDTLKDNHLFLVPGSDGRDVTFFFFRSTAAVVMRLHSSALVGYD